MLVVAATALVLGLWLATGGGAVQKVSQQLGLKDGILAVYNQNAATHHVYADIKGVRASDRSPANGRYFILGTSGSEFVVTDGQGIYKTNEQIITSKLTTKVGEAATTQVRTISFNDEDAIAPLQQLRDAFLGLFSLVGLMATRLSESVEIIPEKASWYPKSEVTFSDVLTIVRRQLWRAKYLVQSTADAEYLLFPAQDWESLIDRLATAA